MRVAIVAKTVLVLALALHLHHRFHGPPIDYLGLAAAAGASWVGLPGPGESLLIAAGIFAAHHRLDIASVIVVAWIGATVGGVTGWVIGMKAGRRVLSARGPLWRTRLNALSRGDEVFRRFAVLAILLTPSWIAGIHRVGAGIYLVTNAVGAAVWAVGIGLGAYFLGPPVIELANDLGWVTIVGLLLLVGGGIALQVRRHRRRGRTRQVEA